STGQSKAAPRRRPRLVLGPPLWYGRGSSDVIPPAAPSRGGSDMRMTWWTLIVAAGLAAGDTGQASAPTASRYAGPPGAGGCSLCVTINYIGATGAQLAHDMVGELRHRGLPAYLFNNASDKQKEQERIAQLKQQHEQAMQEFAKQMGAVPARGFKGV